MFGYAKGATSSLESVYLIVLASFVFFFKKKTCSFYIALF